MRENSAKSDITKDIFEHNGATCFNIDVPNIGPARAITYDIMALKQAIDMAKRGDKEPNFLCISLSYRSFY